MTKVRPNINREVDLEKLFDKYNEKYFNNELSREGMQLKWNNRLTSVMGRVGYKIENRQYIPYKLELSYPIMSRRPEMLLDTMVHEMIHVKYPSEGHGVGFMECVEDLKRKHKELHLLGVRYKSEYGIYRYVYECEECGSIIKRRRALSRGAVCGRCRIRPTLVKDYGSLS